jgi:hypothetical protein
MPEKNVFEIRNIASGTITPKHLNVKKKIY